MRFLSRNHPKILMYHRISENPNGEGISADQFRRQVDIIKKYFQPMTLRDLMHAHDVGKVPEHAVVVTFDDGYSDFAEIAYPILKEAGVPATLFVTTGFVNGDLWLWPDQLRYAIQHSVENEVVVDGMPETVNLSEDSNRAWNRIADFCLGISNKKKLELIDELFIKLGVNKPKLVPDCFRPISWSQLRSMSDEGLDIGSHSISHPILTKLNYENLLTELAESRNQIESKINRPVVSFCYPNGRESDYNFDIQKAIDECGYEYAVAAFPGLSPLEERWCIKRYPVGPNFNIFEKNVFGYTYFAMKY